MTSIDVVVPCYQYGRFLRQCVTSVLTQDVDNLRILIIDNASTDNSVEIAKQLAAEDARVEFVGRTVNLGQHASYNEGIRWASSKYFLLVDADDLLVPGSLRRAIAFMEQHHEISFVYGIQAILHGDGTTRIASRDIENHQWDMISGRTFIEQVCQTGINHVGAPTVVRRTSAQKRAGYYRPEYAYCDDMDLWLRLACLGDVAKLGMVQAFRRLHDSQHGNYYQSVLVRDFIERKRVFEGFFLTNEARSLPGAEHLFKRAQRSLGEHAYWSSVSHLCRGYVRSSWQLFKFAVRYQPRVVLIPPVGWLVRVDRPLARVKEVLREAAQRLLWWKPSSKHRSSRKNSTEEL